MEGYILPLGAATIDIGARSVDESLFQREKMYIDAVTIQPGGDAVNQALTVLKLGGQAVPAICIGRDDSGMTLMERLRQSGAGLQAVTVLDDCPTTCSVVLVQADGQRHIMSIDGAHRRLEKGHIPLSLLDGCAGVSLASFFTFPLLEQDGLAQLLQSANARSIPTFCDMGTDRNGVGFEYLKPFLPYIDYFLPSLPDARHLTGMEDVAEMAEFFHSHGAKNVVIKCGGDGCYVSCGSSSEMLAAPDVPVVDTTGAGDTFAGAFAYGIVQEMDIMQAARYANAAASISVMYPGASGAPITAEAVDKLLNK